MFLIFRDFRDEPALPLALTPEEFRHIRARRLRPGEPVHIGNGRGVRLCGPLADDQRSVSELLPDRTRREVLRPLYLCTAVPSGKRWDWLLEKATELGVSHIVPVRYRRSDRIRISPERARRIFEQAGAQSQAFHLPELLPECDLSELHACLPPNAHPMVPHPEAEARLGEAAGAEGIVGVPTFIIGPEGGFAPDELDYFRRRKWSSYAMGPSILRIETAALAALAWVASAGGANPVDG